MANNKPSQAGGGVRPGTTNFVRNDPKTGAAPKVDTGTWTSGGGNMNTPYTVNPDFDWGAAYDKATSGGGGTDTKTPFDYGEWRKGEDERLAREQRMRDAEAVRQFFTSYGMDALWGGVWGYIEQGYTDANQISMMLSNNPDYQQKYYERFPAVKAIRDENLKRQQQGLPPRPEPNPAAYVELEAGYRKALTGLPEGIWGTGADITEWIIGDVSPTEVAKRAQNAKDYINYSANADIKRELREVWGMTDTEMAAYMLDPKRSIDYLQAEVEKRMAHATVEAAGETAGLALSDELYSQIAGNEQFGRSYGNASAGFQAVAEIEDAYNRLGRLSGMNTTTEELVTDQFGLQGAADAANKRKQLASQERARFQGQSALGRTSLSAGRRAQ